MSRKTSEIKKSIEIIFLLHNQITANLKNQNDEFSKKNLILLEEIELELKNLNTWFDMIYKYNGKSKSRVKVAASRENGKKGGRPPKIITELKTKMNLLNQELTEVHKKRLATFDLDEESALFEREKILKSEIDEISSKIENLMLIKINKTKGTDPS